MLFLNTMIFLKYISGGSYYGLLECNAICLIN